MPDHRPTPQRVPVHAIRPGRSQVAACSAARARPIRWLRWPCRAGRSGRRTPTMRRLRAPRTAIAASGQPSTVRTRPMRARHAASNAASSGNPPAASSAAPLPAKYRLLPVSRRDSSKAGSLDINLLHRSAAHSVVRFAFEPQATFVAHDTFHRRDIASSGTGCSGGVSIRNAGFGASPCGRNLVICFHDASRRRRIPGSSHRTRPCAAPRRSPPARRGSP